MRWVAQCQTEARGGKWWARAWPILGWLNALHVGLAVGMTGWEVWRGKAGWLALALSAVQGCVSGYFWWSCLRTSLLAVMHFSRVRVFPSRARAGARATRARPGSGEPHRDCRWSVFPWSTT